MIKFSELTEYEKEAAMEFFKAASMMGGTFNALGDAARNIGGEAASISSDIGGGFGKLYGKYKGRFNKATERQAKESPFGASSWKVPLLAYGGLGAYGLSSFAPGAVKGLAKAPFKLAGGVGKILASPLTKILKRGK